MLTTDKTHKFSLFQPASVSSAKVTLWPERSILPEAQILAFTENTGKSPIDTVS